MADVAIWLGVVALACWTVWRITEGPSEPTYEEPMTTTHEPTIYRTKTLQGPHYHVDWHGARVVEGDTVLMSVEMFQRSIDILNSTGDLEKARTMLIHHDNASDDPCQDRGVDWPCDVAHDLYGRPE